MSVLVAQVVDEVAGPCVALMGDPEPKAKWRVVPLAQATRLPWSVYGMTGYEGFSGSGAASVDVPAASVDEIVASLEKVGAEGCSFRSGESKRAPSSGSRARALTSCRASGSRSNFHAPVGNHRHPLYHVNQSGMHGTFGHSNHAGIPARYQVAASNLRILKIGGRVFLVTGVIVDGALLVRSGVRAAREGTPAPIVAQAVRTAGSWGMAWAGAKLGFVVGAAAGVETGPGLVLTAIGGGVIGGALGFFGADCIADLVYED